VPFSTSVYILVFLCCWCAPAIEAAAADQSRACELNLVLAEDFNSLSIAPNRIGPARWTAHTPWSGDFGDAAFANPGPNGPFSIIDGKLAITATKDAQGNWKSGLIAAADSTGAGIGTRFGYFEARMKMPPGPGTWPAFWLAALKPAGSSDGNVEIDVVEYYGKFTSAYRSALHVWYQDSSKTRGEGQVVEVQHDSLVEDYHVYGVDISQENLTFFLDGNEVWRQPTPRELDGPMYPLVNLALGSGWPIDQTPNPSTLLVDYVKVYSRASGVDDKCVPGPPIE
jgi:beta-glucanase (GH16 family)